MIKSQIISPDECFVQVNGNIVSDMGGEKVMLSISNGRYYNLGEVGGRIWELIEAPAAVAQIVEILLSEYKIERSECEQQVISFIQRLTKEGLIESVKDDHGHSK
jgi:hypothetical protein